MILISYTFYKTQSSLLNNISHNQEHGYAYTQANYMTGFALVCSNSGERGRLDRSQQHKLSDMVL